VDQEGLTQALRAAAETFSVVVVVWPLGMGDGAGSSVT